MLYAVNWNLTMINGYSGFFPKETVKLRSAIRRLAHTGNLEPLRNVGVRYLFVDKNKSRCYLHESTTETQGTESTC